MNAFFKLLEHFLLDSLKTSIRLTIGLGIAGAKAQICACKAAHCTQSVTKL